MKNYYLKNNKVKKYQMEIKIEGLLVFAEFMMLIS